MRTTRTSTDPNPPSRGHPPEYREELHVGGEQLDATVEQLVREGNVYHIIITYVGHTMLEIPLTIGVVRRARGPVLATVTN